MSINPKQNSQNTQRNLLLIVPTAHSAAFDRYCGRRGLTADNQETPEEDASSGVDKLLKHGSSQFLAAEL